MGGVIGLTTIPFIPYIKNKITNKQTNIQNVIDMEKSVYTLNNIEMNNISLDDSDSDKQILNTILAAVSIIVVSLLINQSEEIRNFVSRWITE